MDCGVVGSASAFDRHPHLAFSKVRSVDEICDKRGQRFADEQGLVEDIGAEQGGDQTDEDEQPDDPKVVHQVGPEPHPDLQSTFCPPVLHEPQGQSRQCDQADLQVVAIAGHRHDRRRVGRDADQHQQHTRDRLNTVSAKQD